MLEKKTRKRGIQIRGGRGTRKGVSKSRKIWEKGILVRALDS